MIPVSQDFFSRRQTGEASRSVTILGSTGSIGRQAVEVAALFPDRIQIHALVARRNWEVLAAQARATKPAVIGLVEETHVEKLQEALQGVDVEIRTGPASALALAEDAESDTVLSAIVGAAGLEPTLAAIRAGKRVALANKEALVVAGGLVQRAARESGAQVVPVDSEHSAIFQCLVGEPNERIETLTLTASGGPFRLRSLDSFDAITPEEALDHPNWSMGAKITIDSATLMNKGLEVIEARWLFDCDPEQIEVVVHPESIVHSIVTFCDGSAKAQLGVPDMRVPIQYALTFPDRWPAPHPRVKWTEVGTLHFESPDVIRFPSLSLAFGSLREGGAAPAVLNAANEEAVARFLGGDLSFQGIAACVEEALSQCREGDARSLEGLLEADAAARRIARAYSEAVSAV